MIDRPRTFIFFGYSGSGKGTQTKLLTAYLEKHDPERTVKYFSTGKALREMAEHEGYTHQKVKGILEAGGLLPEFIPISLWTQNLINVVTDNTEHLILDGVSRRLPEAPVLQNALAFYGREETTDVILVTVSREVAEERLLKRARSDDSPEEIKKRFDWYEKNVYPAIDYFRNETKTFFHEVNGEQAIEEVHREVLSTVGLDDA